MFKLLPKSKYPTGMLYFLTHFLIYHTLIIYAQYIKGSKRKTSHLFEKQNSDKPDSKKSFVNIVLFLY